ncbi:polyisoprenoid-binding protein YceI [Pedobacter sp. UYP30]|uniref:YceI family protein n=1 Tax=Pedobacter sp. UYP30 TaxID=1756400 RepID=UPI003395BA94
MKLKISLVFLVVSIFGLSAFTYKADPTDYKVEVSKSSITWIGRKIAGSHNGTILLKSGNLLVKGKTLVGGNFVMDMTSIKESEGSVKLEGHLNSEDFFSTRKFPTSTFVITKVSGSGNNLKVLGNLTIKGITNAVVFPATVDVNSDGSVSALAGKILVDRTKYDIRYGSKSFFDSIGDKAIDNMFEIGVKLVASK